MNLLPEPPSPEGTESQSEASSELLVAENVPQPEALVEKIAVQSEVSGEPLVEGTELQSEAPSEVAAEETEHQPGAFSEASAEEIEVTELDEDEGEIEDLEPDRPGVYILKGFLFTAASIIAIAALVAAFMIFFNHPKDPPSGWIASYTSPGTTGKVLYYLHWTNQNGDLKGQLELATISNGAPQSLSAPTTGLYDRDNHIIYVVVMINGQPSTLIGTINANNDTLILNPAGATTASNLFVFHIGNADDYKKATQLLGASTK